MYRCILILFLSAVSYIAAAADTPKSYTVQSPDGKLKAVVELNDKLTYQIIHENDVIIAPSAISMQLEGGEVLGKDPQLKNTAVRPVNKLIEAPFYKRKLVKDAYNELVLNFKGDYSVIFRAYDEGIAYRFVTSKKKDFIVESEEAVFNFNAVPLLWFRYIPG